MANIVHLHHLNKCPDASNRINLWQTFQLQISRIRKINLVKSNINYLPSDYLTNFTLGLAHTFEDLIKGSTH